MPEKTPATDTGSLQRLWSAQHCPVEKVRYLDFIERGGWMDIGQETAHSRGLEVELARALATLPLYLWSADLDSDGRLYIRFYSASAEEITGWPPEFYQESPDNWLRTVHPEDRPRLERALERVRQRLSDYEEAEYRVIHPDGTIRWVFNRGLVTRMGSRVRVDGVGWDITERRRREEALRDSRSRYRRLFEESPAALWEEDRSALWAHIFQQASVGVAIVDLTTGRFRIANPAFGRMHGYEVDEVIGMEMLDICAPEDRLRMAEYVRLVSQETRFAFEAKHRRRDGTVFPVFVDVSVMRESAGQSAFLVASIVDLTERKQLDELSARLAAIVTFSEDAIVGETADGVIQSWNKGAERLYGYSAPEVIGRTFEFAVSPDQREARRSLFERVSRGETIRSQEMVHRRRDGTGLEVSVTVSPIRDATGAVIGISKIVRDIRLAKEKERQIEASLKEKELLLQEVHHRVKNNLQIISSILFLEGQHARDANVRAVLTEANHRIRAVALIHEQLYRSRDMASVDFDGFLRSLFQYLPATYGVEPGRIQLHLEVGQVQLSIDDAVPCALIADELVSNTLKHAFPEGRRGRVDVTLHQEGEHRFVLEVGDDGVGLPADFDLQNTPTLGLRLMSSLVDQLAGKMEIAREPGTHFRIRFSSPRA